MWITPLLITILGLINKSFIKILLLNYNITEESEKEYGTITIS